MRTDIVFIDDEEDILNLIRLRFRKIAKQEGLKLHLFSTSADFETYIKEAESDVVAVISDINMPNNRVLESLESEKEKFKFSLTYLCSAYDQDEYKDMIDDFNIKFFFRKPLNIEHIKEKVLGDLEERGVRI